MRNIEIFLTDVVGLITGIVPSLELLIGKQNQAPYLSLSLSLCLSYRPPITVAVPVPVHAD
jgi:hypothetical protein